MIAKGLESRGHLGLGEGAGGSLQRPAGGPGFATHAWPDARAAVTTGESVADFVPASGSFLSAPCPVPDVASGTCLQATGMQADRHASSSSWRG